MAVSYGTYTITEVQEGSQIWTSSAAPTTPNYTFDVSKLVGDSETSIKSGDIIMHSYNRYTVLSISSDGKTVLAGNLQSIRGATGAASVTYALIVSNLAIVKDKDGNLSPSTITVTAKSQTGSNAMANYTGRIKIETTTNNSTWTSRINEDAATKTYTIPSDTVAIRCSLYLKGGTTTLLDQQTVPVVSDGIDGTNITITSTSVTYQKGTSGTVKPTGTWETDVQSVSVGQGEYLWTRTIVNYSDGSSTEAYSVSRNAVNGTNGTNGKDGKDGTSPTVSSTVTEYAQSTNGTTPPTSGWDTTPKTATAGQYMWTRVTVTYSDSATAVSYTVSKNGTNGTNGINTATVYLYKKGTTAPSVPSGNTTYTFSTKKLTGTLDSWTQEIPMTGSGQCYVTAAVASSNGTTDTISTGEWSTPIQFNGTNGTNGTDGTNGLNQATIFLYKRGTSVTKPTTSVTYTFSTGKLSAEPNSWTRNIPTINGSPCWVVSATAIGSGTTATIAGSNWSDPIKLVEDGVDGKDAYSIVLTNENHTFAGNTTSAIASEIECNVIAYKGTTQIAATIGTITGQPTGMTTSLLNNGTVNATFKVNVTTSMVTKSGVLTVPITVDGKTFTKEFTYALTLDGKKGDQGDTAQWYYGDSLTHKSGTATLPVSQTADVTVGAMYLNSKTGTCYKCTAISGANATWIYAGNITDSIEIGGRNIIWNSNFHLPVEGTWANWGSPATREIVTIDGENWMHIITTANAFQGYSQSQANRNGFGEIQAGEQIIFSFDAYSKVDGQKGCIGIHWRNSNNTNLYQSWASFDLTTTKKRYVTEVFTVPNNVVGFNIMVGQSVATAQELWITNIKGEKGNKATSWTPAPEDIDADIEEAKKVATNYLSADSTGIMIADMNDGEQIPSEATGNNVFINNISVNIRDGQTTLASFGVDGMQIGLSDESHTTQDYHSWKMIDKEGNSYVHISDLRDTTGWAIFEESYVPIVNYDAGPEPCEYAIELAFPINYNSDIISAEINGVSVDSWDMLGSVKPFEYIKLTPLPSSNDNVTIKYKSSNSALKAYTFGTRQDGSVLGGFSFAEGYNTVARGRYSHAEGFQCKAIGYYSHAEGDGSTAKGRNSHAESSADAYGDHSHAEGWANTYGHWSHAEGYQTNANGNYSHAQNFGTSASGEAQTAIGKYNIEDTNNTYAFIIGNGTSSSARSNALTVKWDGTITAANGFSTANTALTISRVISTTYMNDTAFNRIKAYKKNGMLYLCFNAEFTSAYSVSNYTTIATISGWNAVFDAYTTIPRQNDGSKIVTLCVKANGEIQVYSTTPISSWHRASICIPCSS